MDTKVKTVLREQKLIYVTVNTKVHELLQLLFDYNILSVPVLTEKARLGGEEDEEEKCIGLVDVLDVLTWLVEICNKPLGNSEIGESTSIKTDDKNLLKRRCEQFTQEPVHRIVNLSKRNPYVTVKETEILKDVVEQFKVQRLHRIAVVDKHNEEKVIGILTQHDVLRFMYRHKLLSIIDSQRPVEEIVPRRMVLTRDNTRTIDAFFTMERERITSLPIINCDGQATSVCTASDLKTITSWESFQGLLDEVLPFIQRVREKQGRPSSYLGKCPPTMTISQAIDQMLKSHLHRLFVVDQENKLIGTISLTDIIF